MGMDPETFENQVGCVDIVRREFRSIEREGPCSLPLLKPPLRVGRNWGEGGQTIPLDVKAEFRTRTVGLVKKQSGCLDQDVLFISIRGYMWNGLKVR